MLRSNFKQLIIRNKFKTLFKTHILGRYKLQSVIRTGSSCIGNMFFLTYVNNNILKSCVFSYNHSLINIYSGAYEKSSSLLCIE